jgi:hypothetical protein
MSRRDGWVGRRGSWIAVSIAVALGIASLFALVENGHAEWQPRIVRDGTLSLGLMVQGGAILSSKEFGDIYDIGLGLAVPLRYRIGRESSIGMTFSAQRYEAKERGTELTDPKFLTAITTTLEYYQYFRVRRRSPGRPISPAMPESSPWVAARKSGGSGLSAST